MKYANEGADSESGDELELSIEADSETSAIAKANRRGILVASCRRSGNVAKSNVFSSESPVAFASATRKTIRLSFAAALLMTFIALPLYRSYQADRKSTETAAETAKQAQEVIRQNIAVEEQRQTDLQQRIDVDRANAAAEATPQPAQSVADQVDNDSILSDICQRYPDLEPMLKRLSSSDRTDLALKTTMLVSAGGLTLAESRHVNEFIRQH